MIYHDSALASYCKNHSLLTALWGFSLHMNASQQLAFKKCKNTAVELMLNFQRQENKQVQKVET